MTNEPGRTLLAAKLVDGDQSQRQLAERMGISQAAISKWLKGETRPNALLRSSLEALLGIPPDSWVTQEEAEAVQALRKI